MKYFKACRDIMQVGIGFAALCAVVMVVGIARPARAEGAGSGGLLQTEGGGEDVQRVARSVKRSKEKFGYTSCASAFGIIAITNGTDLDVRSLRNRGACAFTV